MADDTGSVRIQNPGAGGALLDLLVSLADGSTGGGAFFAFASADGVELLLGDPEFDRMMGRGSFELVVGMDAITDPAALAAINSLVIAHPQLAARAFLHSRSALFHPKMCWLKKGRRLELVVGSGNLTAGGLRKNWEAFAHLTLVGHDAKNFLSDVAAWRESHAEWLRQLDDLDVIERARRNAARRVAMRRISRRTDEALEETAAGSAALDTEVLDVLVAEIPRASTRWNQANFDRDNFETFFDALVGAHTRIVLRHVSSLGELQPLESRPGVSVRSHNYRVELAAAAGLPYPTGGRRPIGVFLKTTGGIIVYRLVMPNDEPAHSFLADFLAERWEGSSQRVRRVRTTVGDLRDAWPKSPLWIVETDAT